MHCETCITWLLGTNIVLLRSIASWVHAKGFRGINISINYCAIFSVKLGIKLFLVSEFNIKKNTCWFCCSSSHFIFHTNILCLISFIVKTWGSGRCSFNSPRFSKYFSKPSLKVRKSQNHFFLTSILPKKRTKNCLIPPYESKMSRIKKLRALYHINMIINSP